MMRYKNYALTQARLATRTAAALGQKKSEIVIKNTNILDVFGCKFEQGDIAISDGVIVGTHDSYDGQEEINGSDLYAVPGFIDSHTHIESSLMTPARFQECVLPLGTTTALWDPHEIANVLGSAGIDWALSASDGLKIDLFILAPSCVPATHLETNGYPVTPSDLQKYRFNPRVLGLAEMMNYVGVNCGDKDVWSKLELFANGICDGHAPQLIGRELNCYLSAGIHACHESTTLTEAREKLKKGMHVLVREGSCAKDANELLPIINDHSSSVVALCSDDRNPSDISEEGHLNFILNLGLKKGISPENIFRSASFAPANAYGLKDRGVIAPGYLADIALIKKRNPLDWKAGFEIVKVIKSGKIVSQSNLSKSAENGIEKSRPILKKKNMNVKPFAIEELQIKCKNLNSSDASCQVIGIRPNQIITDKLVLKLPVKNNVIESNPEQDILKIVVIERHHATGNKTAAFCKGFGLKRGAIAASIAHDSHNIVAVGASDKAIYAAQQALQEFDGGIVVCDEDGNILADLKLPIGGLMTDASPQDVANAIFKLKTAAKSLGCLLHEPFLQMSFLALPVIPALKITDKGLVDVKEFAITPVEI